MSNLLTMHYVQPAGDWQSQALPIGNGRLGAMCFGGSLQERLQINESSLWTGDESDVGHYQNLGNLAVDFAHGATSGYARSLDLSDAIHAVQYSADGVKYRREYFASNPAQVLVFRFTSDRPGTYSGTIQWQDAHKAHGTTHGDRLISTGTLSNGLNYETQILLICTGGEHSNDRGLFRFTNADSVSVLVGARTDYSNNRSDGWRSSHPHDRITQEIDAAAELIDDLRAVHIADYQQLFNRVGLELGDNPASSLPTDQRLLRYRSGEADPALEALLFQYGRYLLISSSRGALPANLQGLWNDSNTPPWRCDYHSNINVQMNYWPAEVCNLSECAEPFFAYVNSQRGVRIDATKKYYGHQVDPTISPRQLVRGWTVQTENGVFGAGAFKWNPPGSAWYCLHFWEHYTFTGDVNFLRNVAYPVMKEVCDFWQDHLVTLPDGRLATPDGWSPEHGPVEAGCDLRSGNRC